MDDRDLNGTEGGRTMVLPNRLSGDRATEGGLRCEGQRSRLHRGWES